MTAVAPAYRLARASTNAPYDDTQHPAHVRIEAYACMGQWVVTAVVRYLDEAGYSPLVHQVAVNGVSLSEEGPEPVLYRVATAVADSVFEHLD